MIRRRLDEITEIVSVYMYSNVQRRQVKDYELSREKFVGLCCEIEDVRDSRLLVQQPNKQRYDKQPNNHTLVGLHNLGNIVQHRNDIRQYCCTCS